MSNSTPEVSRTLFAKSALGQQEIQSRSLGLSPLARRLLILIDGKRSFQDLGAFVTGQDLTNMLSELLSKGCIEAAAVQPATVAPTSSLASPVAQAEKPASNDLASLPDASTRTAKQADMARNFMMNTVNTVFQQNTRLTLMEAIFACKTTEDVRRVYPKWVETMQGSALGTKRLPEFREKLFQVL